MEGPGEDGALRDDERDFRIRVIVVELKWGRGYMHLAPKYLGVGFLVPRAKNKEGTWKMKVNPFHCFYFHLSGGVVVEDDKVKVCLSLFSPVSTPWDNFGWKSRFPSSLRRLHLENKNERMKGKGLLLRSVVTSSPFY